MLHPSPSPEAVSPASKRAWAATATPAPARSWGWWPGPRLARPWGWGCSGDFLCPGAGAGALLLGGTGLLFGALVGVFVRTERWEQVYENPVQVGFTPLGRGLGVRLSIRL